jgi:hypothetical protein
MNKKSNWVVIKKIKKIDKTVLNCYIKNGVFKTSFII